MKQKSDFFNIFKNFESYVSNYFNCKIVSFGCDNGKEYCSKDFVGYYKAKGTEISYSTPCNPEQNGCSERLNRTLLDKERTLIIQSELPKSLWGESILCANYIINRSPTSRLNNVTPAEMLYNEKPNVKNLKVFGCVSYLHTPKVQQQSKFDPKSNIYLMVGYCKTGYRF